jgi:hypothetical protein
MGPEYPIDCNSDGNLDRDASGPWATGAGPILYSMTKTPLADGWTSSWK